MAIPEYYEDECAEVGNAYYEYECAQVERFNRMLDEKPFHVQAEVFFVEDFDPKQAENFRFYPLIKTRIVRIFRGEGLRIGDEAYFGLWASYLHITGGESPLDYRELKETKYFELLLEEEHIKESCALGYTPSLDLSCQREIDEPTDNPVIVKLPLPEKVDNSSQNPFQVSPKMWCRYCRAEFPLNSKFCGHCGRKL